MSYIGIDDRVFDRAFGGRVATLNREQGSSVRRLAVLARIRPGRLGRILAGKRPASPAEYGRLVQVLGVDKAAFDADVLVDAQAAQLVQQANDARFDEVFG